MHNVRKDISFEVKRRYQFPKTSNTDDQNVLIFINKRKQKKMPGTQKLPNVLNQLVKLNSKCLCQAEVL